MARGLSNRSLRASVDIVGHGGLDCLPLAEEVAEVGDCVLCVADKLALGLTTVKFLSFNIGQSSRDLAVWRQISSEEDPGYAVGGVPPSSLAMTSALPSCCVSETSRDFWRQA
jgi:hypothetical protein